eukprot:9468058-Pyramimonas_sp.AAC.1
MLARAGCAGFSRRQVPQQTETKLRPHPVPGQMLEGLEYRGPGRREERARRRVASGPQRRARRPDAVAAVLRLVAG